jgi:hypothetical protein
VDLLAKLAQRHGEYEFRPLFSPDLSATLTDIPSFRAFANNSRLCATCDIHSKFGEKLTTQQIPSERVFVTGGYVLSGGQKEISKMGHSQLAIMSEHGDTIQSITEWTANAGSDLFSYTGSATEKDWTGLSDLPPATNSIEMPTQDISLKQRVELSMRDLFLQLGIVFAPSVAGAIPDEFIFRKIKSLGRRHPITRTVSSLVRASDALLKSDDLPSENMSEISETLVLIARLEQKDENKQLAAQLSMLKAALSPVASCCGISVAIS